MTDLKKDKEKKQPVEDTVVAIPSLEIRDPIEAPLKKIETKKSTKFWYIIGFLIALVFLFFVLVSLVAILKIEVCYKILSLVLGFLFLLDLLHSFKFLFK